MKKLVLKQPVFIIIPVFNAADVFKKLVDVLDSTIGDRPNLLQVLVIDDVSTDKNIHKFYKTHSFFSRPCVQLIKNRVNLGFVKTMNRGFKNVPKGHDVLLLNSDTILRGSSIEILQSVAHRYPIVGSVTPLTNNGSIASLFNWPNGGAAGLDLNYDDIVSTVESAKLPTPPVGAPVGVGFCMYLTAEAFAQVGPFDERAFKRGYGEEEDWCYRASQKGYIHLITPETYVEHVGTQSFTSAEKQKRIAAGQKTLTHRYPDYLQKIRHYFDRDPLQFCRAELLLRLTETALKKSRRKLATFILHNDPEHFAGGTEAHVKHQTMNFIENGNVDVFQVFPHIKSQNWIFRYFPCRKTKPAYSINVDQDQLFALLSRVLEASDLLHLHHWLGLPVLAKAVIRNAKCAEKIVTLHDYFALCDSPQLVNSVGLHCAIPKNVKNCNQCMKDRNRGQVTLSMDRFRFEQAKFLSAFDRILVPSSSAGEIVREGFRVAAKWMPVQGPLFRLVANKISVFETPLIFLDSFQNKLTRHPAKTRSRSKVVFLGAISNNKGLSLIENSLNFLEKNKIQAEVWGIANSKKINASLHIRSYKNSADLAELASLTEKLVVCLPSIWPETFSYVLYEALLILKAPVIVGPFGNPAKVVGAKRVGTVMIDSSAKSLQRAILDTLRNYSEYRANIEKYVGEILADKEKNGPSNLIRDLAVLSESLPTNDKNRLSEGNTFWFSQLFRMERQIIHLERVRNFYAAFNKSQ